MFQLFKMFTPIPLSISRIIGNSIYLSPNDSRKFFLYIISCTQLMAATNSASVILKVTNFCVLLFLVNGMPSKEAIFEPLWYLHI